MLCERVIERPELVEQYATNAARVTHRATLVPLLESIFAGADAEHWVARCRDANIPASLVRGVLEALRSEEAKPLLATIDEFETVGHPVRFDGERLPIRSKPPKLGEHTDAVSAELRTTARKAARSTRAKKSRGRP
jgi:crotonobetainyl-CoA:carnitine CoA-transferase CaiB-like acyl-CoA transferase